MSLQATGGGLQAKQFPTASAGQGGYLQQQQQQQPSVAAVTPVAVPQQQQVAAAVPAPAAPAMTSASVIALGQIIAQLTAGANAMEKRQLAMIQGNYDSLVAKVATNEVSAEILAKVDTLVHAINLRDFNTCNAVQADLANTAWTQHGSWIKGLKGLITILQKR
jgi:hypothetical protein